MSDRKRPDHWTRKAKAEGFAARSVYKLDEIQARFRVLGPGMRVLDLGCAPGSWSQRARAIVGPKGVILGIDLTPVERYPGIQIVGSILDQSAESLRAALGGPPDCVLSDMAPNTSGARLLDHCRQLELADAALAVATQTLGPRGAFVVKVFDGVDAPRFVARVKGAFSQVKRVKPEATRDESVEFFLVCSGPKPR